MRPTKETIMTLEEICNLRDKLIMDDTLTQEQQTWLFGVITEIIMNERRARYVFN
jgi:hypothetical protein